MIDNYHGDWIKMTVGYLANRGRTLPGGGRIFIVAHVRHVSKWIDQKFEPARTEWNSQS